MPAEKPTRRDGVPGLSLFRGEERVEPDASLDGLPEMPGASSDLAELLDAWRVATGRLEQTHALLRDEVARLRSELEHKNRELARKNRLADLGEMASHVAHEVRNSLTPITLYLSLVRRSLAGDDAALDSLGKAESAFAALESTVNDLLAFSASRQPQSTAFVVNDLIEELRESLAPQLAAQSVELETDLPPASVLSADREMIRRAVLNLLLNALDAMPGGGELLVTGCQGVEGFELEVADSGPGLDDVDYDRLFEPFFSTKETGIGLGLSVVAHVAEAHGGEVEATNCPQGGAAFTLRLPSPLPREAAA
ncbi:MAG: ATP-binding protein [Planctomycetota bacterium]